MVHHIYLEGIVGKSITKKSVVSNLSGVKADDTVLIHIHSNGGDVEEGWAIHDYLVSESQTVGFQIDTVIEGVCKSIATLFFALGQNRIITPNSRLLIHNPWGKNEGDAASMIRYAEALAIEENRLAEFYASSIGARNDIEVKRLEAAADELKLQQELAKARLDLLEDGANKEILIAQNAAAERLAAITGTGATAEALRLTIAQQTEEQIADIKKKYADEAIAKQQEVYDKEQELVAQRQAREADEFTRRQQAIIAQAEFEFAQQQLGISNQDALFLKTVEGLNALVAIQAQTGQTRAEIDQQYYDFVERNGEISFEQFVDLQARQTAVVEQANQQNAQVYAAFAAQVGDLFGQSLAEQGNQLKGFSKKFLIMILDLLQKLLAFVWGVS